MKKSNLLKKGLLVSALVLGVTFMHGNAEPVLASAEELTTEADVL